MSQTELANKLGLTPSAVSKWEKAPKDEAKGSNEPSARILWQMVKLFELNPDWLFEGEGVPVGRSPIGIGNVPIGSSVPTLLFQSEPIHIPSDQVESCQGALNAVQAAVDQLKFSIKNNQ